MSQALLLGSVILYDLLFTFNLYDYHVLHNKEEGHEVLYRAVYGIDFRVVLNPDSVKLWAHIFTAFVPLFLSVLQVSRDVRGYSLKFHRWSGRLCLVMALISFVPAMPLSFEIHDVKGRPETWIVFALAVIWALSAVLTWYFAYVKDIPNHRAWGVRFTTYTHAVPLLGRLFGIALYFREGAPKWGVDPPRSSCPIFGEIIWYTLYALIPLTEALVWWERNTAKPPRKKA